jgi:hypothetical protein
MKVINKETKLTADIKKLAKKHHLKSTLFIAEDDISCVDQEFHIVSGDVDDETISKLIGLMEVAKLLLLKRF